MMPVSNKIACRVKWIINKNGCRKKFIFSKMILNGIHMYPYTIYSDWHEPGNHFRPNRKRCLGKTCSKSLEMRTMGFSLKVYSNVAMEQII